MGQFAVIRVTSFQNRVTGNKLINFQGCNPGYKAQDLNIFYVIFDTIMHKLGKIRQKCRKSAENRLKFIVNLHNSKNVHVNSLDGNLGYQKTGLQRVTRVTKM